MIDILCVCQAPESDGLHLIRLNQLYYLTGESFMHTRVLYRSDIPIDRSMVRPLHTASYYMFATTHNTKHVTGSRQHQRHLLIAVSKPQLVQLCLIGNTKPRLPI